MNSSFHCVGFAIGIMGRSEVSMLITYIESAYIISAIYDVDLFVRNH
jgi:hypothetical protein